MRTVQRPVTVPHCVSRSPPVRAKVRRVDQQHAAPVEPGELLQRRLQDRVVVALAGAADRAQHRLTYAELAAVRGISRASAERLVRPSYQAIREKTGFCTATIAGALKRLEASGLLRITRRLVRTPLGARQTSNAYSFSETAHGERKPDFNNPKEITNLFKNKGMQPIIPGLVPVPLDWRLRNSLFKLGRTMGIADVELQQKLAPPTIV